MNRGEPEGKWHTHTHAHKKEKTNLSFVSWFFFVSGFHSHRHQTPSRIYKSFVCNWLYFVSPFDLMFGFLFVRFALKIPKLLASICALFHLSGSSIKEHFNFNQLAICSKLKNLINYLIKSKSLLKKWNVRKWQFRIFRNFSDDKWIKVDNLNDLILCWGILAIRTSKDVSLTLKTNLWMFHLNILSISCAKDDGLIIKCIGCLRANGNEDSIKCFMLNIQCNTNSKVNSQQFFLIA